jgi:hypothetical protein
VPEEKGLIERSMAKSSKIFSTESWARQRGISPWRGGQEEEDHDDGGVDLEVVVVVRIAKRPLVLLF